MENSNVIEGSVIPSNQMSLAGVLQIPAVRQIMLLFGVAAAIAVGFAIVLWSWEPAYTHVDANLTGAEAAEVADALRSSNIEFKVDKNTGTILVPEARLHEARMHLASQGLPQGLNAGMSSLDEQSSFGVSQFMESARYQHALEAELAQTISSIGPVREARVHLALPRQSSFIRDRKTASASVTLQLYSGQTLEPGQVSAVVNMVASSVQDLTAKNVTVIDQYGRMLSSGHEQEAEAQAASQFRYARRLEETYVNRIEELLTPLVGAGRIRAQVDADIDFTVLEETRESFDPATTVVRSEQVTEENRSGDAGIAAGIPGALSNQPPEASAAPGDVEAATSSEQTQMVNTSRSSTRNYEVERTISRVRPPMGSINRLSVAVLVDDTPVGEEGQQTTLAAADIERYTALVKEAVGFSEQRGDTVVVVNAAFRNIEPIESAEPPPFWEEPMVRDSLKQVVGASLALALVFGVVRPMLRGVMASSGNAAVEYMGSSRNFMPAAGTGSGSLGGGAAAIPPPKYEEKVAAAKNITGHDPARVAQVVKKWVTSDE